jgi:hypothetical protein
MILDAAIFATKPTVDPGHAEFVELANPDGSLAIDNPLIHAAGIAVHRVARPREIRRHVDQPYSVTNSQPSPRFVELLCHSCVWTE